MLNLTIKFNAFHIRVCDAEVCFQLDREEALEFYMSPVALVGGINKGVLGWLWKRFEQVSSWCTLELVLH